jgi:hypothetical protein
VKPIAASAIITMAPRRLGPGKIGIDSKVISINRMGYESHQEMSVATKCFNTEITPYGLFDDFLCEPDK